MDHTLRFSLRLSVYDYQLMNNSSLASALVWIYDCLYTGVDSIGSHFLGVWIHGNVPEYLYFDILVYKLRLHRGIPGWHLASDLALAQKTESSRPHYVSKDIYSAPEQDSQSRREGHSLETYRTICKELHFQG